MRKTTILASASSDGMIHVYDLAFLPLPSSSSTSPSSDTTTSTPIPTLLPIVKYDTKGTRLICLTLAGSEPPEIGSHKAAGSKRSREVLDNDDDDDGAEGEEEDEKEVEET